MRPPGIDTVITVFLITSAVMVRFVESHQGCPSQELILPCRCLVRGEEFQIWCSHSDLPRVLEGLRVIGQHIFQPIDELILENNNLPSLPGKVFLPLQVMRLMLRYNGLERVSSGWLSGQEKSLMELFIVEPALRGLPEDSLSQLTVLEAVTIQSNLLKRLPNFSRLPKLRYLQVESLSLLELSARDFKDLPVLEKFHISGSPRLTRLEADLLQDLPQLSLVNISYCGINWMHPRAVTRLPVLTEFSLVGNKITDAGMIGRGSRDLPTLSTLRLDFNHIDKLGEAAFVDLPALKKLSVSNNRITELHHGAFHRVPMLRVVDLNNNIVRRVHPESFLQHSGSGLEELWLVDNDISHVAELRSLLDALPRLTFLDMSRNNLEAVPFGALRGHATLERLHLDYNKIHLVDREAFMAMPALRELRLKNNSLSDMLDGPLWNLPALKGLDLSGNYYRRLNARLLGNLPSLRRVDLSANDLTVVDPDTFLMTKTLEHVNLSHNALLTLHPATFRHLIGLYELDVSYNKLSEFVPNLPRGIEYLHISYNQINYIPVSPSPDLDLPALRMLDISGNGIMRIPPGAFRTIPQLKKLYLGKNLLQGLEENALSSLERLEILDLQHNRMIDLHPNSLNGLTKLHELNLRNNRLTILRPEVFQNIPNLTKLDISQNQLNEILPEALENTRNIEIINASHNLLENLPSSLYGMKKLITLDLTDNRLKNIQPETLSSLSSLTELRMSHNLIQHLRKGAFNNLQHLKELYLDNNQLQIIEPNAVRALPVLKFIKLNQNQIKEIPHSAFNHLPSLQTAELQENNLISLAGNSFNVVPHLLLLNLSNNQLVNLDDAGLRSLRSLELLDVSGNRLTRVAASSLEKMDWLVELRMDDNQICAIHGSPFNSMPRLRVLSIRNNKMMSFPEQAVHKLRGNLAVLDIDGNPLVCSCSLLWMRGWLQETSSIGPRCVDGTLLREMRLSRQECSSEERLAEPVAPGCEAELLSVPGLYATSQVFSQWMNLKDNRTKHTSNKNNIAPSPEESDYFYDEYIDYPYNETNIDENNGLTIVKTITTTIRPIKQPTTQSSHYIPGDTPTIYAAVKNKTKTPDAPKEVINSPSSSGFTFFGVPLPSISLNNLLGGNNGRIDGKKQLTQEQPIAQRKNAIVNNPSRGSGRGNTNPPTVPDIQTGGFIPVLPGSGGFKPIQTPLPQVPHVSNITVNIERVNVTHSLWPVETSTEATNLSPTTTSTTNGFLGNGHPIPLPTVSSFTSTLTYNNNYSSVNKSISHLQTKLEINPLPSTQSTKKNTNIEIIGETNKQTSIKILDIIKDNVTEIVRNTKVPDHSQSEIETGSNSQSFENIFKEVVENVSVPAIVITSPKPKPPKTIPVTEVVNESQDKLNFEVPISVTESHRKNVVATPLSALLVPGGQQPQYRPAGRPTITKVLSPHASNSAPLHSSMQVSEESAPMPHRDVPVLLVDTTTQKIENEDKSWYFMNYNNTNIPPYVGGNNVNSQAVKILSSMMMKLIFIVGTAIVLF